MIGPKTGKIPKSRSTAAKSKAQVEKARPGVYHRDDHHRVVAGSLWDRLHPCNGPLTIQYAVGKGSGGSARYDSPEWLRAMCLGHNNLADDDAVFARHAKWFGWSVERGRVHAGTITAELVPVRYPDGADYVLDGGYGKTRIGIDYSGDDHDRYEAEFLADLAEHDAAVKREAAAVALEEFATALEANRSADWWDAKRFFVIDVRDWSASTYPRTSGGMPKDQRGVTPKDAA